MVNKKLLEQELERGSNIKIDEATIALQERLNKVDTLEESLKLYFDFHNINSEGQENFYRLYEFLKKNRNKFIAYIRKVDPDYFLHNKICVSLARVDPDLMMVSAEYGKYVLKMACIDDIVVDAVLQAGKFKPVRKNRHLVAPSRKYLHINRYKIKDIVRNYDIALPSSQFNYSNIPYKKALGSLHVFFEGDKMDKYIGVKNSTDIFLEYSTISLFKKIDEEKTVKNKAMIKNMSRHI